MSGSAQPPRADGVAKRWWLWVFGACLIVGLAWSLRPLAPGQGPENWFPSADKVHHLWWFALLFWLGHRAGLRPAWTIALGLFAYGAGMELLQGMTPSRSASGADLLADSTGIALSWWVGAWLDKSRRHA